MKLCIIFNEASGRKSVSRTEIETLFPANNSELVFLDITTGLKRLTSEVERHKPDVVVAVGGDGTVNAAANVAVATATTLGVIPAGTLNHFAKDVGVPLSHEEAVTVIIRQKLTSVDYCTVNGTVFVNNASIGVYPKAVKVRDNLKPNVGKRLATVAATGRALLRLRKNKVSITYDHTLKHLSVSSVFVGNNIYGHKGSRIGNRDTLQRGKLFILVITSDSVLRIFGIMISALLRRSNKHYFVASTQSPILIDSQRASTTVSYDGEVVTMTYPLTFVQHARQLKVCV